MPLFTKLFRKHRVEKLDAPVKSKPQKPLDPVVKPHSEQALAISAHQEAKKEAWQEQVRKPKGPPPKFSLAQKQALGMDKRYQFWVRTTHQAALYNLQDGGWTRAIIASADYIEGMIELEKLKKPDWNVHFTNRTTNFAKTVAKLVADQTPRAQIIAHNQEGSDPTSHTVCYDYQLVDGKASLIGLESGNFKAEFDTLKLQALHKHALEKEGVPVSFITAPLKIQKSETGCPIFALMIGKTLYRKPHLLDDLHKDNVAGKLLVPKDQYPKGSEEAFIAQFNVFSADAQLPVELLKYSQSSTRTKEYLKLHPGAGQQAINQKGQTVEGYFTAHTQPVYDTYDSSGKMLRAMSSRVAKKQITYLEELTKALEE